MEKQKEAAVGCRVRGMGKELGVNILQGFLHATTGIHPSIPY